MSTARNQAFDVVLVDTAGRMQDNAPLMTALAKLIAVNMPDLVLFVGEALVGNEAVDQLVRPQTMHSDDCSRDWWLWLRLYTDLCITLSPKAPARVQVAPHWHKQKWLYKKKALGETQSVVS